MHLGIIQAMMTEGKGAVWKSLALVETYLQDVRGAIPLAREQIEVMTRLISARNEPVSSFLDLGCGDGLLAAAILDCYPNSRGALIDFSEPMIERAKTKLALHRDNLLFATIDYGKEGWMQSVSSMVPFDVVVSGFSIHHQPDERKRQLYAEIHDLLGPGGLFINIEHVSSPTEWIENVWEECFIDSLYTMNRQQEGGKTRKEVAKQFHGREDKQANILAPVEMQCDWLREIGYLDVDCFFKLFELAVFGGRRAF